MKKTATVEAEAASLYDSDFFEWTQTMADSLRHGRLSKAELERVAAEIADMGKRDRRELASRTIILLMHLIKWAVQPERRAGSTWLDTIAEQRIQIEGVLEQSPSLLPYLTAELPRLYSKAFRGAERETLPVDVLLSPDFFPEQFGDLFIWVRLL